MRFCLTVQERYGVHNTHVRPSHTVKLELSFLKVYDKNKIVCDSFSIFSTFLTYFDFQGGHILANLVIHK